MIAAIASTPTGSAIANPRGAALSFAAAMMRALPVPGVVRVRRRFSGDATGSPYAGPLAMPH